MRYTRGLSSRWKQIKQDINSIKYNSMTVQTMELFRHGLKAAAAADDDADAMNTRRLAGGVLQNVQIHQTAGSCCAQLEFWHVGVRSLDGFGELNIIAVLQSARIR